VDSDELYGLPLERFVPERDALAKSLRAAGRREEASRVAKLRKPSVAAWAVNQLVRTQGRALNELLEAGDSLTQAHAAVLSGTGDGRSLRHAVERQRAAVEALLTTARGLLTSDGHDLSSATIDRVAGTLHAAALDQDAREQVRHGRLERELRHVGLGAAGVSATAPARAAKPANQRAEAEAKPKREPERSAERTAARQAARAVEADARRRAGRAERALRTATQRRDRATEQLREAEAVLAEAEEALAQAEAEARAAAEAHARARDELE
jgi:hypothetical protein